MTTPNLISFPTNSYINCQKCSASIVVYHLADCDFLICPTCRGYLKRTADDNFQFKTITNNLKDVPVLKLGSTGTINSDEFKVIAYLEKKENGTQYNWREYILLNQQKGYVTLAEFDGHWSIIKGKEFYPDLDNIEDSNGSNIRFANSDFHLFNKYVPKVTAAIGEFGEDVLNEKINAVEFVAAPYMIVNEKHGNKSTYYLGEYIDAKEIAEGFKLNLDSFPEKVGIGAIQPSIWYNRWDTLFPIMGIAIVLVLLLHLLIQILKPEKELFYNNFDLVHHQVNGSDALKSFTTSSFEISDESSNLEFSISSPVSDNWLEATIVLVNNNDNRTWEVSKGFEYYSGYEDGESWSEGDRYANIMLSHIPKGKYHLNVYPYTGDPNRDTLQIKVTANSSLWRNTLITCLVLCLYPAFCWYRMRNFEKKRWDNSDYSPYIS